MLYHVGLDVLNIEAIRVVAGTIVLDDGGDLATVLLDELGGPVADSAEALNDKSFILNACTEAATVSEGLSVKELTNGVVDTKASRLGATSDTALGDELASAAAFSVDILLTLDINVGVFNPSHNLLVGSHVGTEAINLSTDKALFDELHGVLACHSLDLILRVLFRVNLDTTLGATEGHVSNGQLEGHKGSESLNFLQIDVFRVAGASLDWQLVSRVLCAVACDSLEGSIVSAQRDVEPDDGLA